LFDLELFTTLTLTVTFAEQVHIRESDLVKEKHVVVVDEVNHYRRENLVSDSASLISCGVWDAIHVEVTTLSSTTTTVRLPRTTKSGSRASRFSCNLPDKQPNIYVDVFTHWTSKYLFRAISFNLILA
jgi:hypothetical protein